MKFYRILLLLTLFPACLFAQTGLITGKVFRADTKAPLAAASVFLGNSSFGTPTAEDGSFTLSGLKPGQYSLVVTTVGYEDHYQSIVVSTQPINLNIELAKKTIQLKEVNISSITKSERRAALEQFKVDFIGNSGNAANCKITNPDVLNFAWHQNKSILNAYTDEFLIIENKALGYRIKFLLKNFESNNITGTVGYSGQQTFEDLKGGNSQKKKWRANRDIAYYGSAMHFYRSLIKDSLAGEGFKIYSLTRELNDKRPADDVIEQNLNNAIKAKDNNAFFKWTNVKELPVYSKQIIGKNQYSVKEILKRTDQPGLFAVKFPDCLYIIYSKKWETSYFKNLYRAKYALNYETSVLTLLNDEKFILIDANGSVINESPLVEGTWSKAHLAERLPVDYEPTNKPPQL